MTRQLALVLLFALSIAACTVKDEGAPGPIPAPADVAKPPADAPKTPAGIASRALSVSLG